MGASLALDAPAAPATALCLGADLGIEQAAALKAELMAHLDDAGTVRIDAAEVQRIHAAAVQLFCVFCRDRRASGREVEFLRPSANLRQAVALLGATPLLRLSLPTRDALGAS